MAVEPLSATLKDNERLVREAAAEALEKIGAPAVEPLVAALKDADKDVRPSRVFISRPKMPSVGL